MLSVGFWRTDCSPCRLWWNEDWGGAENFFNSFCGGGQTPGTVRCLPSPSPSQASRICLDVSRRERLGALSAGLRERGATRWPAGLHLAEDHQDARRELCHVDHQPHPGSDYTLLRSCTRVVLIQDLPTLFVSAVLCFVEAVSRSCWLSVIVLGHRTTWTCGTACDLRTRRTT